MKITYTPNPLNTIVELDLHEVEALRMKIKIDELEELLYDAHFHLKPGTYYDLAKATSSLDPNYWCQDGQSKLDERVEELLTHYVEELVRPHCGDCICFACSCSKCHAETLLKINTIPGLGKYSASRIETAFKDNRTIDQAIEHLRTYNPVRPKGSGWDKFPPEYFDSHVPRWLSEAKAAYKWLSAYNLQHFSGDQK